jgi:hypothetical protein
MGKKRHTVFWEWVRRAVAKIDYIGRETTGNAAELSQQQEAGHGEVKLTFARTELLFAETLGINHHLLKTSRTHRSQKLRVLAAVAIVMSVCLWHAEHIVIAGKLLGVTTMGGFEIGLLVVIAEQLRRIVNAAALQVCIVFS